MNTQNEKGFKAKIVKCIARHALKRLVSHYLRGVQMSREAAQELLHGLPGVFSMTLSAGEASLRLIKEADTFRIMENAERCENLLTINFEDLTVLGEIVSRECTMQKALSERRLTFTGKTHYLTVFLRAGAAGDKAALPNEEYVELYGNKTEV